VQVAVVDANGTRHHLLLGPDDWARCNSTGTSWDPERAEVTLQPRLFEFVAAPKDVAPDLSSRRGAGRDQYGNWYWIGRSRSEILVNSSGSGRTTHFWASNDESRPPARAGLGDFEVVPAPAAPPLTLSGLAVTEDHYLVVGVLEPAGVLIFDLYATGGPRQLGWPTGVKFVPFDMAPRRGGGVWILDRINRRYWGLDRRLNVLAQDQLEQTTGATAEFQSVAGDTRAVPASAFPEGILVAATDPVAIDALPDDSVILLDGAQIYRYRFGQQLGLPVGTDAMVALVDPADRPALRLVGYDFTFEPKSNRLYVVSASGNQAFAFAMTFDTDQLTLVGLPQYLPMRLFGGQRHRGRGWAAVL
jgi:hypothetical protein